MTNEYTISLNRLAALAGASLSTTAVLWFIVVNWVVDGNWSFIHILVSFGVLLVISFFVLYAFINQYLRGKINLTGIDKNNNLTNIIEEGTDQSEIEKTNQEVAQWAKNKESELENLKKLELYRRNFVGNISHELKTPIFSIQGYLHTLLDGGLQDEKINKRYIKRAVVNANRLQNIVDDLEVIIKLEEEKEINPIPFDLKELVKNVFLDFEAIAKKKNIKLSFIKKQNKGFKVLADKEKIRHVFTNLIGNSIKYGKDQGKTQVGFIDHENYVEVIVQDNGIGIAENNVKYIFDRFYRVDSSGSRKSGGSGLGLSIVKHILEAHNSKISVESELNKGTIFTFPLEKK